MKYIAINPEKACVGNSFSLGNFKLTLIRKEPDPKAVGDIYVIAVEKQAP